MYHIKTILKKTLITCTHVHDDYSYDHEMVSFRYTPCTVQNQMIFIIITNRNNNITKCTTTL